MFHESEKDTTWSRGELLWGKPFDVSTKHLVPKEVIYLPPNPWKKKRHYVKYNHKTVLLAQGSGRKFLTVAKSIKFCFTWIFVLCEVMRKMEHLVFLGITCRKSWILPTLLLQCDIQIPLTTQASSSAESIPSTWTQQGGLLAVVSYRKC